MIEVDALAESTRDSAEEFLGILGFDVALEDKKNKAFATSFGLLGVDMDL